LRHLYVLCAVMLAAGIASTPATASLPVPGSFAPLRPVGATWTESELYTFSGPDGRSPAGLVGDTAGNLQPLWSEIADESATAQWR
jgi:hypothetical protein